MLRAAERYDLPELVNLSSGAETSIRELVDILTELTRFRGRLVWEADRPDGQRRRCFDVTKARRELDFQPQIDLREGLRLTVAWYKENMATARLTV